MVSTSSSLAKSMVLRIDLLGLARQTEDEVAVNRQPQLVAVAREVACALDGGALLDVLQDLLIA